MGFFFCVPSCRNIKRWVATEGHPYNRSELYDFPLLLCRGGPTWPPHAFVRRLRRCGFLFQLLDELFDLFRVTRIRFVLQE